MSPEEHELWKQQVGARLSRAIAALGHKPAHIARTFKISQQRLSNYVNGIRPLDIEIAMMLSARFGITLDWLYMGDIRGLPFELAQKIALSRGETERTQH